MLDRRALFGGIAGAAALVTLAKAGPLDPPAGPVASTGKTLTELEPRVAVNAANTPGDSGAVYVISQPGSYYLTGNITVPALKVGVRIAASRVRLDLNGFRVASDNLGISSGITDGGVNLSHVTVRNGCVATMIAYGINLGACQNSTVEDVMCRDCDKSGVVLGAGARVERTCCVRTAALSSGVGAGIQVGDGSAVVGCMASFGGASGILTTLNCRVEDCICTANARRGIDTSSTTAIARCVVSGSNDSGIIGGGVVLSCAVSDHAGSGISTTRAVIEGCAARANVGTGINGGGGGTIRECASSLSTSPTSVGHGFSLGSTSVIVDCAAYSNAGSGIFASRHSHISGCTPRLNAGDGIATTLGTCLILHNTCSDNGTLALGTGAGIRADGAGSRIEGNLCTGNSSFGISVMAAGNIITRNACSLNQVNWSIASNCVFGPIVDRTVPSSTGMSGNGTVVSTLGSADPHANFSF